MRQFKGFALPPTPENSGNFRVDLGLIFGFSGNSGGSVIWAGFLIRFGIEITPKLGLKVDFKQFWGANICAAFVFAQK